MRSCSFSSAIVKFDTVYARIDKTVFLSYRRTNVAWALAIYQDLTQHGYDVFFDFEGLPSGDFEGVIIENIIARAHFIALLTPSALDRCYNPADTFRIEIETALVRKRNIVPLMLEGFDFKASAIVHQLALAGTMGVLKHYQALSISPQYFRESMDRLRKLLTVPLTSVLHPASLAATTAATEQKAAAGSAPIVNENELLAQQWFERVVAATDVYEKVRFYTEVIRIRRNDSVTYYNRGLAQSRTGDLEAMLADFTEAIRLRPGYADAFNKRGNVYWDMSKLYWDKRNLDRALKDYTAAIRFDPSHAKAFHNRGVTRAELGDLDGALQDYDAAIRLDPCFARAFYNRSLIRRTKGD
jgi:tetratricopeptide (TPR) repeat protein